MRDFAPTFLEAAGVDSPRNRCPGAVFWTCSRASKSGRVDAARDRVLLGKERHDLGRPFDQGYPVRAIRTPEFLYVLNYEPDRWPVGNPETGYRDCDDGPTKTCITSRFDEYYRLCFGKRPREELYRITDDPDCVKNLATDAGCGGSSRSYARRWSRRYCRKETLGHSGAERFSTHTNTWDRDCTRMICG